MKWAWPINARKAHAFIDSRSLCGRWLFLGVDSREHSQELGEKPGKSNCVACWRKAKVIATQLTIKGTD